MASYDEKSIKFIVEKVHSGMSVAEASRFFSMSRDTIHRWLKWDKKDALHRPKPSRYRSKLFTDSELSSYIKDNNDSTLSEISNYFNCSESTIFRRLNLLNITRKKKQLYTPSEMKKRAKNSSPK